MLQAVAAAVEEPAETWAAWVLEEEPNETVERPEEVQLQDCCSSSEHCHCYCDWTLPPREPETAEEAGVVAVDCCCTCRQAAALVCCCWSSPFLPEAEASVGSTAAQVACQSSERSRWGCVAPLYRPRQERARAANAKNKCHGQTVTRSHDVGTEKVSFRFCSRGLRESRVSEGAPSKLREQRAPLIATTPSFSIACN